MAVKEFIKRVPSDPDLLPEIEEFVIKIVSKEKISKEKLSNFALSISEASANSIVHGNQCRPDKFVDIKVVVFDDRVEVTFTDEGKGFSPDSIPDPTEPENIFKDHGRGIHIMKNFLTDLRYKFTDRGTITTLVLEFDK